MDEAALVAAIDCQVRAMRLPPWREEEVPCMASRRGKGRAARLLRRMSGVGSRAIIRLLARLPRRARRHDKEKPPAQSQLGGQGARLRILAR